MTISEALLIGSKSEALKKVKLAELQAIIDYHSEYDSQLEIALNVTSAGNVSLEVQLHTSIRHQC